MQSLAHITLFLEASSYVAPDEVNERWLYAVLKVRGLKQLDVIWRQKKKYGCPEEDVKLKSLIARMRRTMCVPGSYDADYDDSLNG